MKPMLAVQAKEITFPVYASPKIDGIRAYVKDGQLLSRSGKRIPNRYVQETYGQAVLDGVDGELCVGQPNHPNLMQLTTSGVMSFDGRPHVTFWLFDVWAMSDRPFEERLKFLNKNVLANFTYLRDLVDKKMLMFLPQFLFNDMASLNNYEELCLGQGYEGVMLRNPKALYKFGRSTAREGALLKVKRWTDSEATVTGFNEFMHNGNTLEEDNFGYAKRSSHQAGKIPMNTLGSLSCVDVHSGQTVDIGTGFTQDDRQRIWTDRNNLLGKIVKYKHFAEAGVKDAPRFPVFVGFRHPEDMG